MFCLILAAHINQSRLPVSQSVQLCVKWAVSAEATSLADEHSWITSMTTSSTPMKTSAKVIKCHHVSSVSHLQGLFIMSDVPENSLEIFHLSQRHPSTDVPNWTCQLKDSRSTLSYAQGWSPEARIGIWKGCLDLFFVGYFSIRSPEAIFCDDIIMKLICSKTAGESEWKSWFGAALVKYVQICPNWTSLHGDGNGKEYAASPSAVSNSSGAPEHWQDASYQPVRQKNCSKMRFRFSSSSGCPGEALEKLCLGSAHGWATHPSSTCRCTSTLHDWSLEVFTEENV